MSLRRNTLNKLFVWIGFLTFLLACLIPSGASTPVQPVASLSQSDLGTIIAQTADAAYLQTASAAPSPTATFTPTRIPSKTATFTPTFIYIIPTITSTLTRTPAPPPVGNIIVNGTIVPDERLTDRPWTCLVTGVTPPRGAVLPPGKDFYVTWTVMNTGTKPWWNNGIDFLYQSGYRTDQRQIQDLPSSVSRGNYINVTVLFTAPKTAGTYSSIWGLRVGQLVFCRMKTTFIVE